MRPIASAAVVGLGVIGAPLADKLLSFLGENFCLIADSARARALRRDRVLVNGKPFSPNVLCFEEDPGRPIDLILLCVKNYSLEPALREIEGAVGPETILVPLQNGIYAHGLCEERYPDNVVLRAYIQGPNTRRRGNSILYTNPGTIHFGSADDDGRAAAHAARELFDSAGVRAVEEAEIERMVWKKLMLNVAGNTVSALTRADYSDFKMDGRLVDLCRASMLEFVQVAQKSGVSMTESDIEDIIDYFCTYEGSKRTSMLEDVIACRRTENEYLAGEIVRRARECGVDVPINETLYKLMSVKESLYLNGRLE